MKFQDKCFYSNTLVLAYIPPPSSKIGAYSMAKTCTHHLPKKKKAEKTAQLEYKKFTGDVC